MGVQPVREAIRAHKHKLDKVIIGGKSPRLEALCRFAKDNGIAVEREPRSKLDKLSGGVRHQGAAAYAPELVIHDLSSVDIDQKPILIALDQITDPHNFGATIRSAVAIGAAGVIWGEHHAAPLTPATFRASAGAVEHAHLIRVPSLRGAIQELTDRGAMAVALDADADIKLGDTDLSGACVLVVGAEDEGVTRGVRRVCQARAKLTMSGKILSLNASVAAAIALYEAKRQHSSDA